MAFKKASGDKADTGTPVTPAPRNETTKTIHQLYGENLYAGGSSLTPGQKHTDDWLAPADATRDALIAKGPASAVADLSRKLDGKNVADAFGMGSNRSRQSSSHSADAVKVPRTVGEPASPLPNRKLPSDR